jgi:tight adherence protein C
MAEVSAVRRRLVQAGYLQPSAVGAFYLARVALAAGLPLVFLVMAPMVSGSIGAPGLIAIGVFLALLGSYLPILWINLRTRSLQRKYLEGFPDALDLLVVCVEAGLGLDGAINRVADELGGAHRALGENFKLMALELRAGKSRQDALRNLAERLGLEEVRAMVTLLLQSEELGTSIAEALRVYSDEMRVRRMLRAEAKAMALPVKLAIPLALFVFPVMMIVIMLPVVIRIKNQLLTVDFG